MAPQPAATIGIPRALLYYHYFPAWKAFFEGLGLPVAVSGQTTGGTLDSGVMSAVDDACLPVKIFYGHVRALKDVDFLFVPRVVSVTPGEYTCPKLLGLPDMIKGSLGDIPPLIDVTIDMRRGKGHLWEVAWEVGKGFAKDSRKVRQALERARRAQAALGGGPGFPGGVKIEAGGSALTVGLLGHRYLIHDRHAGMNLPRLLEGLGVSAVTAEDIDPSRVDKAARGLPKNLFWTFEKEAAGAALYLMESGGVHGIIHLVSFGCGPDSMITGLLEAAAKEAKMPFMVLVVDEHTGEAGVSTRVEAFVDMLEWRRSKAT